MNWTEILVVFDFVCAAPFFVCVVLLLGLFAVHKKKTKKKNDIPLKCIQFFFIILFRFLFFFFWLQFSFYAARHFHRYANTVVFDIQRPLTKLCSWYACIILCAVSHFILSVSFSVSMSLFHSPVFQRVSSDRSVYCTILHCIHNIYEKKVKLFACCCWNISWQCTLIECSSLHSFYSLHPHRDSLFFLSFSLSLSLLMLFITFIIINKLRESL